MWPYTHDESNWLAVVDILETSGPRDLGPHSVYALEAAARRYRAQVIAGMLTSAARAVVAFVRGERRLPKGAAVRLG